VVERDRKVRIGMRLWRVGCRVTSSVGFEQD